MGNREFSHNDGWFIARLVYAKQDLGPGCDRGAKGINTVAEPDNRTGQPPLPGGSPLSPMTTHAPRWQPTLPGPQSRGLDPSQHQQRPGNQTTPMGNRGFSHNDGWFIARLVYAKQDLGPGCDRGAKGINTVAEPDNRTGQPPLPGGSPLSPMTTTAPRWQPTLPGGNPRSPVATHAPRSAEPGPRPFSASTTPGKPNNPNGQPGVLPQRWLV